MNLNELLEKIVQAVNHAVLEDLVVPMTRV